MINYKFNTVSYSQIKDRNSLRKMLIISLIIVATLLLLVVPPLYNSRMVTLQRTQAVAEEEYLANLEVLKPLLPTLKNDSWCSKGVITLVSKGSGIGRATYCDVEYDNYSANDIANIEEISKTKERINRSLIDRGYIFDGYRYKKKLNSNIHCTTQFNQRRDTYSYKQSCVSEGIYTITDFGN